MTLQGMYRIAARDADALGENLDKLQNCLMMETPSQPV